MGHSFHSYVSHNHRVGTPPLTNVLTHRLLGMICLYNSLCSQYSKSSSLKFQSQYIHIYTYIIIPIYIYIIILYIHTLYVHIECIKCPSYEVGNCLAGFFPGLPFSNALQVGRSDAGFFKGLLDCFSAVGRLRWVGCGAFWSFVQTYQKLYKVVAPPVISWFINPSNYRYLP